MGVGRVRRTPPLGFTASLRRLRPTRVVWVRPGAGMLVRLMGMAGGCFLAVGRGCRVAVCIFVPVRAGRRQDEADAALSLAWPFWTAAFPDPCRSRPVPTRVALPMEAASPISPAFWPVAGVRLIRAAGRALRFALLPVATPRQDVDQPTAVGGGHSHRGDDGHRGRGLDERRPGERLAGARRPRPRRPGRPRDAPWAPSRMPCRRLAAAAAGSGAIAAKSRLRSEMPSRKARQSGQARRWARMSRRRITRRSPSESARQTSSQRISRPSLICWSPIRAS